MEYLNERPVVDDETGEVIHVSLNPKVFDNKKHHKNKKHNRALQKLVDRMNKGKGKIGRGDAEKVVRRHVGTRGSGQWLAAGEDLLQTNEGKKRYKGKYNPWAVCHASTGPKKSAKFERCVQHVKLNENQEAPEDLVVKAFRKRQKVKLMEIGVPDRRREERRGPEARPRLIKSPRWGSAKTAKPVRTIMRPGGLTGSDTYRPTSSHATLVKNQPWRMAEKYRGLLSMWRKKGGGIRQVVKNIPASDAKFGGKRIKKLDAPNKETDLKHNKR